MRRRFAQLHKAGGLFTLGAAEGADLQFLAYAWPYLAAGIVGSALVIGLRRPKDACNCSRRTHLDGAPGA